MSRALSFAGRVLRKSWHVLTWIFVMCLIMAVPVNVGVEYSNTPKFCGSCHIMDPYYDSWEKSAHSKFACTECHFPPSLKGKLGAKFQGFSQLVSYVTATEATRPTAHVEDGSCTQCHAVETLGGRKDFGKVKFDHAVHFQSARIGIEVRCTTCHVQITQDEHISVDRNACIVCHLKDQEPGEAKGGCLACHDLPQKKIESGSLVFDHATVPERGMSCADCHANLTVGDAAVSRDRCLVCHSGPDQIGMVDKASADPAAAKELHKYHVTEKSIECRSCHDEIRHGKPADPHAAMNAKTPDSCGSCHATGHGNQIDFQRGIGGIDVPETPSLMQKCGVTCTACHDSPNGHGAPTENRCIACHGAGARTMLSSWKTALDSWKTTFAKNVESTLTTLGGEPTGEAKKLLDAARQNASLVEKSRGVHNIAFSQALYSKAFEQLTGALTAGQKTAELAAPIFAKTGAEDCRMCHAGIESIETRYSGAPFPHSPHLGKANLDCDDCHKKEGRPHGQLDMTADRCTECHHEDDDADCAKCHADINAFYGGHGLPGATSQPDVMNAQVPCVACHADRKAADQVAMQRGKCVECHDEKYGPMFDDWMKEETAMQRKLAEAALAARIVLEEGDRKAAGFAEAKKIVEDAEETVKRLREVRSPHNPAYARTAVEKALESLAKVASLVKMAAN